MNPGSAAYFEMGTADRDITEHMWDLKVKYPRNFADSS